jgi:hypothetical protein
LLPKVKENCVGQRHNVNHRYLLLQITLEIQIKKKRKEKKRKEKKKQLRWPSKPFQQKIPKKASIAKNSNLVKQLKLYKSKCALLILSSQQFDLSSQQ